MPLQEPGSRPARPLPYAPYVDAAVDTGTGKIALTFSPGTEAGAQFYVTSGNRADAPWTYTAGAGRTVTDAWNSAYSGGSHDLTVHGPNGFLRTFRSPGSTAGPEVTARHNGGSGNLDLTIGNAGDAEVRLTLANADAYGGAEQAVTVRPGATVSRTIDLRAGKRWYDVTVTAEGDPASCVASPGTSRRARPGSATPEPSPAEEAGGATGDGGARTGTGPRPAAVCGTSGSGRSAASRARAGRGLDPTGDLVQDGQSGRVLVDVEPGPHDHEHALGRGGGNTSDSTYPSSPFSVTTFQRTTYPLPPATVTASDLSSSCEVIRP